MILLKICKSSKIKVVHISLSSGRGEEGGGWREEGEEGEKRGRREKRGGGGREEGKGGVKRGRREGKDEDYFAAFPHTLGSI